MTRNYLVVEIIEQMKPSIKRGLQNTAYQEREDLKQEISLRLVQAANDMEVISFWEFKKRYDKRNRYQTRKKDQLTSS
ncbi:hypothetical protein [Halobacillus massiliensis]|uniref:hypothetical protein n=1 Tax=Halobacillus massiliensis TaxID=1926286 RepID=UPI0009E4C7B2|nr:hypothetical protein [Halobacillus massiliensis]